MKQRGEGLAVKTTSRKNAVLISPLGLRGMSDVHSQSQFHVSVRPTAVHFTLDLHFDYSEQKNRQIITTSR